MGRQECKRRRENKGHRWPTLTLKAWGNVDFQDDG